MGAYSDCEDLDGMERRECRRRRRASGCALLLCSSCSALAILAVMLILPFLFTKGTPALPAQNDTCCDGLLERIVALEEGVCHRRDHISWQQPDNIALTNICAAQSPNGHLGILKHEWWCDDDRDGEYSPEADSLYGLEYVCLTIPVEAIAEEFTIVIP